MKTHNPEDIDKVDVALHLFDGRHDKLNAKLTVAHRSSHSSWDIALPGNKKNKLPIINAIFSIIRNTNTIEQGKLESLHYDNNDVTTMSKACLQIEPQEVSPMLLSSHMTTKSNNVCNNNKSNNTNNGITFPLVDDSN